MEKRITDLEDEFEKIREELKQIMIDIRTYMMEANSPLQGGENMEELPLNRTL